MYSALLHKPHVEQLVALNHHPHPTFNRHASIHTKNTPNGEIKQDIQCQRKTTGWHSGGELG
jgi:hypothetical protein